MSNNFINEFNRLSIRISTMTKQKGFTDKDDAKKLLLMHSEISEACEWLRIGNPKSNHIPEFSGIEEELADVIIRIMHYSIIKGFKVADAIIAKIEFNKNRPFKHNNKLF